jgi:hypothetical protein
VRQPQQQLWQREVERGVASAGVLDEAIEVVAATEVAEETEGVDDGAPRERRRRNGCP